MSTLAERINGKNSRGLTRDSQGNLVEETTESIQTLSKQAGLAAPPITPGAGSLVGANADSSKMLGTPAQKTAALNLSTGQNLQQQQRLGTQGKQDTTQQQGQLQTAQKLAKTGDRVQDLINTQINALGSAQIGQGATQLKASQPQQQVDVDAQYKIITDAVAQGKPATDPAVIAAIQKLSDMTGQTTQAVAQQVNDSVGAGTQAGSITGAQGALDNAVRVGQVASQLGTSAQELADLLSSSGTVYNATQVENMSIADLQAAMQQVGQAQFSQGESTDAAASSGLLSAAERQAAREQGRLQDVSGVTTLEGQFGDLEQELSSANTVQFAGRSYTTEELLGDENISNLVSQYLAGGPQAEVLKKDPTAAGLIQFIEKHRNSLTNIANQFQNIAKEETAIQEANKTVSTIGGTKIDDTVMKALIPEFGSRQAKKLDPNSNEMLKFLNTSQPALASNFITKMNELGKLGDSYVSELKGLSPAEMTRLRDNPQLWDMYINGAKWKQGLEALPPGDIDAVINYYSGGALSGGAAKDYVRQNKTLSNLGLGKQDLVLDANNDGVLDNPSDIYGRLKQKSPNKSLSMMLEGQGVGDPGGISGPTAAKAPSASAQKFLNQLGILDDGKVTKGELSTSTLTNQELRDLRHSGNSTLGNAIEGALTNRKLTASTDLIKRSGGKDLTTLKSVLNDPDYDKPTIEKAIAAEEAIRALVQAGVDQGKAEAAVREQQRKAKTKQELNGYIAAAVVPVLAPALLTGTGGELMGKLGGGIVQGGQAVGGAVNKVASIAKKW